MCLFTHSHKYDVFCNFESEKKVGDILKRRAINTFKVVYMYVVGALDVKNQRVIVKSVMAKDFNLRYAR